MVLPAREIGVGRAFGMLEVWSFGFEGTMD